MDCRNVIKPFVFFCKIHFTYYFLHTMKFKISHSMLGIAYASQVLSTSAWADAGHNHADHDRAFLAWVASIKASEAASGAEATPQDVWREGVVLSVDRQNKLIQIQQKNVPTAKQGDAANEFSIADINLGKVCTTAAEAAVVG